MERTDFQDSYDEESSFDSGSSDNTLICIGNKTIKINETGELQKDSMGDNSTKKHTPNRSTYSKQIMGNTKKYDTSTLVKSRTQSENDVYHFSDNMIPSEQDMDISSTTPTNKKRKMNKDEMLTVRSFFLNASLNGKDSQDIRSMTPAYGNRNSNSMLKRKHGKVTTQTISSSSTNAIVVEDADNSPVEIELSDDAISAKKKKYSVFNIKKDHRPSKPDSIDRQETLSKRLVTKRQKNVNEVKQIANNAKQKLSTRKRLSHEVYVTDNDNQDSMHQETDYGDSNNYDANMRRLTQDSDNQEDIQMTTKTKKEENKKKKPSRGRPKAKNSNNSDDDEWSDDAQENFLYTLKDQPLQELTEKEEIQWAMFAERLLELGTSKTPEQCKKQVY